MGVLFPRKRPIRPSLHSLARRSRRAASRACRQPGSERSHRAASTTSPPPHFLPPKEKLRVRPLLLIAASSSAAGRRRRLPSIAGSLRRPPSDPSAARLLFHWEVLVLSVEPIFFVGFLPHALSSSVLSVELSDNSTQAELWLVLAI
uniref:Uncharacterized protein n=1 Tax=Oryza glumipatula TaxID=40148 RepID=A0A0D9ZAL1_9ORYZ